MPKFSKRPLEFYGRFIDDAKQHEMTRHLRSQECPFLKRKCLKPRKSDPSRSIGSCTVGYQEGPLVICPYRFLQNNQIFLDAVRLLKPKLEYYIVPEITMPGGNIDYFLVGQKDGEILDFLGIEIQSLDTTGSGGIWKARQDLTRGQLQASYAYEINWKMSAKTILIQMHHKSGAFEALDKKLLLIVQKSFFDYMSREFRTKQLRDSDARDSIHFHVYDCVQLGGALSLVLRERKSTDVRGIEEMLKLGRATEITVEEVIKRIRAKMSSARRLEA